MHTCHLFSSNGDSEFNCISKVSFTQLDLIISRGLGSQIEVSAIEFPVLSDPGSCSQVSASPANSCWPLRAKWAPFIFQHQSAILLEKIKSSYICAPPLSWFLSWVKERACTDRYNWPEDRKLLLMKVRIKGCSFFHSRVDFQGWK